MEQRINNSDPVDELLDVLRDRRRRLVIYYLHDRTEGEPVRTEALASAIATMELAGAHPWETAGSGLEFGRTDEEHDRDRTDQVLISLVHTHLPKLHETGIVAYDAATGTVRATHPPEEFLKRLRSHQRFSAELAATEVD